MPDIQFIGFKSYVQENTARTRTFLGCAAVVLPKEMCEQRAHIAGLSSRVSHFDNGDWLLACNVVKLTKTGEIIIEVPAKKVNEGMWYDVVKLADGVRAQILELITPHLPQGELTWNEQ